jgi:V/A-type H+-transporting ATPase subunit D
MKLRISPTRIALLNLKKRLVIARRGHKLLKDKLEGLLQAFMPIVEEYGQLRLRVDRELPRAIRYFVIASATSSERAVELALEESETKLSIEMGSRNVMSVPVPELKLTGFEISNTYSTMTTSMDFDSASRELREIVPLLLNLANLEETIIRLSEEIEKTRRRVNALEYVLIPSIKETVKAISSKLEENDRSDRARLMKVKDMLAMGA